MTRLVARLVLAMLLLPATGAVFVLTFIGLVTPTGPPSVSMILLLWAVVYTFVAVYWLLLWRHVVRWTQTRRLLTFAAAPAALAIGGAVSGFFLSSGLGAPPGILLLVGGGVVPIVWVIATVVIWRETPRERAERLAATGRDAVSCPICGYNLTGLDEARCPECGTRFTLDGLFASQPQREAATIGESNG